MSSIAFTSLPSSSGTAMVRGYHLLRKIPICATATTNTSDVPRRSVSSLLLSNVQTDNDTTTTGLPRQFWNHPNTIFRQQQQQQQTRSFARTSEMGPNNDSPEVKAKNLILQIGHPPKVAQGVIEALEQSGLKGTALLSTVRSMAGRWEVGEDAGLESLVEAVTLQLARKEGRTPITLYCIPSNAWKSSEDDQEDFSEIVETQQEHETMVSRAFVVEAMTGLSLTDVAKFGDGQGASELGNILECACAGIMACSTCHVVVDPKWFDKVGEPCESEQDMLDLAYAPRRTSRLGCQINLDESMDGMIIRLPKGANNLMDDIPFED